MAPHEGRAKLFVEFETVQVVIARHTSTVPSRPFRLLLVMLNCYACYQMSVRRSLLAPRRMAASTAGSKPAITGILGDKIRQTATRLLHGRGDDHLATTRAAAAGQSGAHHWHRIH
jgi:hypothetical protein